MRNAINSSMMLLGIAAILLLGGCGSMLPETRPAFGYSGLQGEEGSLSNYQQGKVDFAAGRYGLAIDRFRAAMAENPESVEAVNGLAASYDQIGRFDLAERYYRRALAMDPNSAQTLNNLGYSLHLQGKHDLAVALFGDAIRRSPEDEIVTANANKAIAALTKARKQATAETEPVVPASQQLAAAKAAVQERARVVRINPGLQKLELVKSISPRNAAEPGVQRAKVKVPGGPAIAPQPLIPVLIELLPAVYRPKTEAVVAQPIKALPSVRVAEPIAGRDVLVEVDEPVAETPLDLSGTIEVSNGTGRRYMAARMRTYLADTGLTVGWLSNADHFSHASTTITYVSGHRGLAEALSASLPIAPRLLEVSEQAADVRIELGGDLLQFDFGLLQAEKNNKQAERNRNHVDAV